MFFLYEKILIEKLETLNTKALYSPHKVIFNFLENLTRKVYVFPGMLPKFYIIFQTGEIYSHKIKRKQHLFQSFQTICVYKILIKPLIKQKVEYQSKSTDQGNVH